MKTKLMITISCILFISCTNNSNKKQISQAQKTTEEKLVSIDFKKVYTKEKFPYNNHSLSVQKLEESEDSFIGYIDKLFVNDEYIYILDRSKSKSLFIYNRDGKLMNKIEAMGNGPGEYVFPQDFQVDKNGNIIIMDSNSSKLIFYTSSGKFIKEIKYDFIALQFILDKENNILFDNGNIPPKDGNYFITKMNMDGKVLDRIFPSNETAAGITFNPRNSLQKCGNEIYFLPTLSNCIYTLEGNEPVLEYEIDFGEKWPSLEFFTQNKRKHPLEVRKMLMDNNYAFFLNYIQTEDVLHLDFYLDKNYSYYYNKKTKQSLLQPMEDKTISFPLATYNDQFIIVKYKDSGEPILVFYTVSFEV